MAKPILPEVNPRNPDDPWSRFFPTLAPMLRAAARRWHGGTLDIEDAAQEAWLVLATRATPIAEGAEGEAVPAQLVVVVPNHLADLGRRERRLACRSLAREVAEVLIGPEEDPADATERIETREAVGVVLAESSERLSGSSHRILVLRWIEGRSFGEIAEAMEMPVGQVRDRHRRAIRVLRPLLIRRLGTDLPDRVMAELAVDCRDQNLKQVLP